MTPKPLTLVGDGIENPLNALTMIHAAGMFTSSCLFRDRCGLAQAWLESQPAIAPLPSITHEELGRDYSPLIALDNLDGADSIYGCQIGRGPRPAVVVGNERKGVAQEMAALADRAVQIPMVSRKVNCLNVAAAAAVALYYLSRGGGGKLQIRSQPNKRRPELLLMGAADHVELGSSIRSAGAFGWGRLFVEDRQRVWFGCDRATITEGRAAARRARNPIRVIPTAPDRDFAFAEACVLTVKRTGVPLHQTDLARGAPQLIIIPDESAIDVESEHWERFARDIHFVRLSVPATEYVYRYRLIATIALAEAARQVGQQARPGPGQPRRHEPFYDRSLRVISEEQGELIFLEDLVHY